MSLGEKLKEARKRKGFTQQQVADLVGVKKNTITGYEKGDRQPDVIMLKKLITALDVSSSSLLELPVFDDSVSIPSCILSERAIELGKLYDSLSEEGREMIDKSAEFAEKHFKL